MIVEYAEKWVKESASDMLPGGFMLAVRRCLWQPRLVVALW